MAIESMTGFSRCEAVADGGARVVCEIRSVNGKSLDMRLRLPSGLERLELPLRQLAQQQLMRGNLQLSISVDNGQDAGALAVNELLLEKVLSLADILHTRHGLALPSVGELLAVRGVLDVAQTDDNTMLDLPVIKAVETAIAELKVFRRNEGKALTDVLLGHVAAIEALVAAAANDPSRSPESIRDRLAAQVRLLMESVQGFDEQRLSMEAALLATKADIREELDRLTGHIAAARQLLASDGPVGRKLDFLAQEFNREANTLCSKSNAATVTTMGLELKAIVDQFREQVQNLE